MKLRCWICNHPIEPDEGFRLKKRGVGPGLVDPAYHSSCFMNNGGAQLLAAHRDYREEPSAVPES